MADHVILDGRKAEILLVEDNLGDELLALRAFRNGRIANNFTVAGTAEEAWAMLKRHGAHSRQNRPDLILLDLNLPRMGGKSLLMLIKEDPELKSIPIVIMTSSEATADVKRCNDLQASAYVIKPMDLDAFKTVVETIEQMFFSPA